MAVIPGSVETDQQPPMTLPLRHFVVGLFFMVGGTTLAVTMLGPFAPGLATLAHVHLLLVGWICVTIMGAMTQFVPVWSGVSLHSRRLVSLQLLFVVTGSLGFVVSLLATEFRFAIPFGGLMLVGFWTFVYNIGRTMAAIEEYDVTERHFLLALVFFLLLTVLGFVLTVDFTTPLFDSLRFTRHNVIAGHATLAVFGAVLTTIYGALYQLGTMFTQTELHGIDTYLRSIEAVGHPVGVVLLAGGRLLGIQPIAQIGGLCIVVAAVAIGVILARKLHEMQVPRTPMHTRYAVAIAALLLWAAVTLPAWIRAPIAPAHRFGAAGASHLLLLGAIGFVVLGTLYHIIPFIIWVHQYSDRLGLEDVPMVDDLYNQRMATVDIGLLVSGSGLIVVGEWFELGSETFGLGGGLVVVGLAVFTTNMVRVIQKHSPDPLGRVLFGAVDPRG